MSIIFTFPPELKVYLFSYFTLYELLQMRLVSRQWKILMEEVGSFKTELGIVTKYTKENTAFNSVKLSRRRFDDEPPLLSPDGAHFLSTIFPNITKATFNLNEAEYSLPNCFNFDILFQWAPNLTYLKFNMECLWFSSALVSLKCAQLLAIISTLPALTHLHLTDMGGTELPEPFPVLSGLEKLNLDGYFKLRFCQEYLEVALRQVGPSLTSLAVDTLPDVLPESTITKLSSSLTKLTIYEWEVYGAFITTLRRLQGLTVLDLCAVRYYIKFHFPDLMAILVDLPQLHTVSLNTRLLSHKINPPYSFLAHPAVRELYLQCNINERYDDEMRQLSVFAYAFPNVNKVTIAAYDVHEVRPFLRIDDDHHPTLENYVKGHFGKQIEVELVNMGHWGEELGIDFNYDASDFDASDFDASDSDDE